MAAAFAKAWRASSRRPASISKTPLLTWAWALYLGGGGGEGLGGLVGAVGKLRKRALLCWVAPAAPSAVLLKAAGTQPAVKACSSAALAMKSVVNDS